MDESVVPAKTISFDATEAFSQGGFLLQSQLVMDLGHSNSQNQPTTYSNLGPQQLELYNLAIHVALEDKP